MAWGLSRMAICSQASKLFFSDGFFMGFFQETHKTVTVPNPNQKTRVVRIFAWGMCVLLSPLCALALFSIYGFDTPFQDGWEFVPVLKAWFEHSWTTLFAELWTQHNEHRLLVPRMVMLVLAVTTGWNLRYENIVTYLCAWMIFALLVKWLYQDYAGTKRNFSPGITCLVSLLVFSLTQWHMWLWGWMMQIEMNVLFCCIGFRAFSNLEERWKHFWVGCLAGLAAMFSFGTGLAFFPLVFLLFLLDGAFNQARKKTMLATLVVVSVAAFGAYFWGFNLPEARQIDSASLISILRLPVYVLAYLGAPLASFDYRAAVILGLTGTVMWTRQAWRVFSNTKTSLPQSQVFWMFLGLYAVSAGVLTAFGRWASNPLSQALSSRYLALPSLFWISIIVQRSLDRNESQQTSFREGLLAYVVICLVFISSVYGTYKADEYWDAFQLGRKALLEKADENNLHWLYPSPEVIRERREFLKKYRLSIFRERTELPK